MVFVARLIIIVRCRRSVLFDALHLLIAVMNTERQIDGKQILLSDSDRGSLRFGGDSQLRPNPRASLIIPSTSTSLFLVLPPASFHLLPDHVVYLAPRFVSPAHGVPLANQIRSQSECPIYIYICLWNGELLGCHKFLVLYA